MFTSRYWTKTIIKSKRAINNSYNTYNLLCLRSLYWRDEWNFSIGAYTHNNKTHIQIGWWLNSSKTKERKHIGNNKIQGKNTSYLQSGRSNEVTILRLYTRIVWIHLFPYVLGVESCTSSGWKFLSSSHVDFANMRTRNNTGVDKGKKGIWFRTI